MRLNLRQIEAFRAVVETGSMTEAGVALGITQPAVSRLVRDFEDHFDLQLFRRQNGRVEPTQDALALHQEVERCFGGLDQVVKFASDLSRYRRKTLRIAAPVGHSYFFLPRVIEQFNAQCPDVTVSLRSCSSPDVAASVASGQSDIGIAILPSEVQGVVIKKLPEINLVCVLPENHPLIEHQVIGPKELAEVPLLLVSDYSLMSKRVLQAFKDADVSPNVIFDCTYAGPICSLVASGMGVSILDRLTADAYADKGIALRQFEPAIPCELKLVLPANHALSAPVEAVAQILQLAIP
ncbi:MAG: LysR substrate-binding domain-containing protein [Paracoccaceae bacterium]